MEPALIDRSLPAQGEPECEVSRLEASPSYSTCGPAARASYLTWLKTGRCHPLADMGCVWLYFYGLERRLLHDSLTDPAAAEERPLLVAEVQRLLGIYATRQPAFREQATRLLDFAHILAPPSPLYLEEPGPSSGPRLSVRDKRALGQCIRDAAVLPAAWAAHWLQYVPGELKKQLSSGDPHDEAYDQARIPGLFGQIYRHRHGEGLVLQDDPARFPRLQASYTPASPSFRGNDQGVSGQCDVPDVERMPLPASLLAVGEDTAAGLASDHLPPSVSALWRLACLPLILWPAPYRAFVEGLVQGVSAQGGLLEMPLSTLLEGLPPRGKRAGSEHSALCRLLWRAGLAMEPDPAFGGRLPPAHGIVVIFATTAPVTQEISREYALVALQVRLAVPVVLHAVSDASRARLRSHVRAFPLSRSDRPRIEALLRRALADPSMPLVVRVPREARLDGKGCRGMGDFLMHMALAGKEITPEQVTALEDGFELVGLGRAAVLPRLEECERIGMVRLQPGCRDLARLRLPPLETSQVTRSAAPATGSLARTTSGSRSAGTGHSGQSPPHRASSPATQPPASIELDSAKVDALHKEQQRLTTLLEPVFAPAPEEAEAGETGAGESNQADRDPGAVPSTPLLKLDPAASAFLRALLTRPRWSREALDRLAREHGVPLDGVLEQLNEASYERLEVPLFEIGEYLVLNAEAIEKGDLRA